MGILSRSISSDLPSIVHDAGAVARDRIIVDDAIMVLENITRYAEQGKAKSSRLSSALARFTSAAMGPPPSRFWPSSCPSSSCRVLWASSFSSSASPSRSRHDFALGSADHRAHADLAILEVPPRRMDHAPLRRLHESPESGVSRGVGLVPRRPKTVVATALLVFSASMFLVKFIKKEFIPSQDQNRFLATITLPLGVSINYTDGLSKKYF